MQEKERWERGWLFPDHLVYRVPADKLTKSEK